MERERDHGGISPRQGVPALGRWLLVARRVFSLAVIAALAVVCVRAFRGISSVSLHVEPAWLGLSWLVAVSSFPLLAVCWTELLAAYGHRLPLATAVRLWCLAQASRYLPTGLAAVASRAVLASRHGVPRTLSVLTMAVEGGLLVSWSALGAGLLLLDRPRLAIGALALGGLLGAVTGPGLLRAASRVTRRWVPLKRLAGWQTRLRERSTAPLLRPLVLADAIIGISLAIKTVAFVVFARALLPVRTSDLALLAGAANLAVVAGLVGVTPAGIGVREGVLIALLGGRFGTANVTAMALALRVFDLTVELPWVLGSVIANRRHPTPSPVVAPAPARS
ncbi:MAG: hypothetical protein NVSMB16_04460 [Acidimicrobiales bacterium]